MDHARSEDSAARLPALLVGPRQALQPTGGGVQVAAREYRAVLAIAGFDLEPVPFDPPKTFLSRVRNRLAPRIMSVPLPVGFEEVIEERVRSAGACAVFFLPNLFPQLSGCLRRSFPQLKQILLSVGVESIDFCIDQQLRRRDGKENRRRAQAERMLGQLVLDEAEQRVAIDAVLTLSSLEVEAEKWLGAARALWLPRIIMEPPLVVQPVDGRVGCVSTLNHPPNLDGLVRLFEELQGQVSSDFRFRLVGQPETEGQALVARFPFVEYLGGLDDARLRAEATTWCCFVHPLWVYAKGCSTKLAVGLGWGLPVAATEFGARGYRWDEAALPLARTPKQMASAVIERSRLARFGAFQAQTQRIVEQIPSIAQVAAEVRQFLLSPST